MAYEESIRAVSLKADASLSEATGVPGTPGSSEPNYGKQYAFVKITGVSQVGLATTKATDRAVGVMVSKPQVTGQAATVAVSGLCKVRAGAALTAGALVTCDATGRAITGVAGTDQIYGVAVTTATAANQVVVVALQVG